jgi:hypothetical protein
LYGSIVTITCPLWPRIQPRLSLVADSQISPWLPASIGEMGRAEPFGRCSSSVNVPSTVPELIVLTIESVDGYGRPWSKRSRGPDLDRHRLADLIGPVISSPGADIRVSNARKPQRPSSCPPTLNSASTSSQEPAPKSLMMLLLEICPVGSVYRSGLLYTYA